MDIITEVLRRKEFADQPPVLVDIGASEQIHKKWKKIASHSICIAFDADYREFEFVTKEKSSFKKLHIFNCIVSDTEENEIDFYLTKSPYCSSTLIPDERELSVWAFADKFNVEKKIKLKTISLQNALKQVNLDYVDWFKTDSQGTDLRLFKNLGDKKIQSVIAAEFEPGIINAYAKEDKFFHLLEYMGGKNFWLSDLSIKGSQRISKQELSDFTSNSFWQKLIHFSLITSPGWSETTFINDFKNDLTLRSYLLGWVFSTILRQHGFAYHLANIANKKFNDAIFPKLLKASSNKLKFEVLKFKFIPSVFEKLYKMLKI